MSRFDSLGTLKEVELPQGKIRYREAGTGEPLLFVHGFLVNGDLWRKVVPILSKHYRCIAPDWPLGAHELPMNPDTDLTPTGIARIIASFIEALELRDVTIVGNDSGGAFSQVFIANYPQYAARLVLFNCDAFDNFPPFLLRPFKWFAYALPVLIQYLRLDSKLKRPIILWIVAKKVVEREAIDSYTQSLGKNRGVQHDVRKLLKGVSSRYTNEAAKTFPSFNKPVLIIWAPEDFFFPVKDGKRLANLFPKARLEFIKDSRTFISEDQPEKLAEHIKVFLAQNALTQVS